MFAVQRKRISLAIVILVLVGLPGAQPALAASTPQAALAPALTIAVTPDRAVINTGEPMGFTILVANIGTDTAAAVQVTDPLPGSALLTWKISPAVTGCSISRRVLTCVFGDLPAGQSRSVHVVSGNTPNQCTLYNNTATVTAGNHPSLSASAVVQAVCPDIVVSAAPLASPIFNGEVAAFAVTVQNTGAGAAKSVRLLNTLPTVVTWKSNSAACRRLFLSDFTCSLGELAPGGQVTVTFSAVIPTTGCGFLQDDAFVSASNEPGGTGNNSASAVVEIHCPNLQVTNTPDADTVESGAPVGLMLEARNDGTGAAYKVTLKDVLPAAPGLAWVIDPAVEGCTISSGTLTCTRGALAGGERFAVHVTSPTTTESCGSYTNTAELQDQFQRPVTAGAEITILCPPPPPPDPQ